MATVYAARVLGEGAFQKPVALKLMLPHLARDEKFVAMFMDEAALAANIQSPYVVATYDLGREGDETLYMALEMVLGRTLRELGDAAESAGKAMPLDVALTILVHAALGLEDAHRAKNSSGEPLDLVHRDISPHNVLVGLDGRARIADFGIARAIARTSQTETGELKGKLAYFSPEQLRGQPLDQRSDVFALGIVAWELLAGKRLFEADNPLALADRIANAPIRHLDTVRKDLPAGAAAVIASALVRDPQKRLASASALAEQLSAAMAMGGLSQASPARVGEIVRALGGDKLLALESRIATVIREVPLPMSSSATGANAALRAPVSVPPPGPTTTASGTGTGMVIVRRGPSPFVLAVAAVLLAGAGAGAVFFAMRRDQSAQAAPTRQNAQVEAAQQAAAYLPSATQAADPARAGHAEQADTTAGIATTPAIVERLAEAEMDGGAAGALADDDTRRGGDRAARRRRDARREAAARAAATTSAIAAPVVTPTPVVPARGRGIVGVDEFDEGNR